MFTTLGFPSAQMEGGRLEGSLQDLRKTCWLLTLEARKKGITGPLKGLQSKERRRGHTLVDPFEGRLLPKRLSCSSGVRKPG